LEQTLTLIIALFVPAIGWAQYPEDVPLTKLAITPAKAPSPALKYRLVPPLRDLRPGNAALLYQRAHSPEWFGSVQRFEDFDKLNEYLDGPLEKMPRSKVESFTMRGLLNELDLAARRRHCDWEMVDRIRTEGFAMLLPDVQSFRTYGNLLSARTRVLLLDRKFDKAVHSLQTHFALARHVSEAPILINVLVGNAILQRALHDLEALAQVEGAPSMFWALADLPQPFLHLERALEGERLMIDAILPGIREALDDPTRPPLSVEQIRAEMERNTFFELFGRSREWSTKLALVYLTSRMYPSARAYLISRGFTEKQLDAMPVTQVSLMHVMAEYDRLFDEFAKWYRQPRWIARAGLRKADEALPKSLADHPDTSWLGGLTVPGMNRVHESQTNLERRIALARIVEALRLYAGEHEGRLPATLADIKDLPLPLDPMTGQAFQYTLTDGKALLVGPSPPGAPANRTSTMRYEISIRK